MRRFLIAAGLALLLHVLLFSAKADWLKKGEVKWSRPEPITLALTYHQPPKPRPKPQKRIAPPKPKTVIHQQKTLEKEILSPPLPQPQTPPPPVEEKPIPEPMEVKPEPSIEPVIQKPDEPIVEVVEQEEEPVIETAAVPEIQSIDAYIVEDMADEPPAPEPLPIEMAVPTYREEPVYPRLARRRGYEGTVILKVLVGVDGSVADLEILESSGHDILDRTAEKSVRKWMFEPWKKGDEPIEMWGQVVVRFQLK